MKLNLQAGIALFSCDKNIGRLIFLQESNLSTSDWLQNPANPPYVTNFVMDLSGKCRIWSLQKIKFTLEHAMKA